MKFTLWDNAMHTYFDVNDIFNLCNFLAFGNDWVRVCKHYYTYSTKIN